MIHTRLISAFVPRSSVSRSIILRSRRYYASGKEDSIIFMKGDLYEWSEVSKHDKEDDCWIVINKKVYDVTKFVDEHPGGDILLVNSD